MSLKGFICVGGESGLSGSTSLAGQVALPPRSSRAAFGLQTVAGQCAKSILLLPVLCDQPSPTQEMLSKLVDPPNLALGNQANCVGKSNRFATKMLIGSRLIYW